jgi:hypothetical protein
MSWSTLKCMMRDSIRMYFAPLTGAIKGIRSELHRVDREIERNRQTYDRPQQKRGA